MNQNSTQPHALCAAFSVARSSVIDDSKRTESLKVFLTEREYLDLCRLAAREDRKPGELIRVIARRFMYGSVCADAADVSRANGAEGGIE